MLSPERQDFLRLLGKVYAFYERDFSNFAADVWWQAMRPFELAAVRQALSQHCLDPQVGAHLPKPADLVRQLGPYQRPAFEDPKIAPALQALGGWTQLCAQDAKAWPRLKTQFLEHYRQVDQNARPALEAQS